MFTWLIARFNGSMRKERKELIGQMSMKYSCANRNIAGSLIYPDCVIQRFFLYVELKPRRILKVAAAPISHIVPLNPRSQPINKTD